MIETGSKLARKIGINAALSLEVAKGRFFEEGDNGFFISNDLLNEVLKGNPEAINTILRNSNTILTFEEFIPEENLPEKAKVKAINR